MPETKYIILRNSVEQAAHLGNPSVHHGHKFAVVYANSYKPRLRKTSQPFESIGGNIDMAIGFIYYEWQGEIRTTQALTTSGSADGYGSLDDLKGYFLLNNPMATPSNLITLVDHYGVSHDGYLVGDFEDAPMTVFLQGDQAHYFIGVNFIQKAAVT